MKKSSIAKFLICVLCVLQLSGCVFITHKASVATGIEDAKTIVIIKNASTKEGFLNAVTDWLAKNDYKYTVVEPGENKLSDFEWALDYYGTWRWDVSIFLDDASIRAFKDGEEVGYAKYNVGIKGGYNLSKWRSAEETIFKMLDNLFGKNDVENNDK